MCELAIQANSLREKEVIEFNEAIEEGRKTCQQKGITQVSLLYTP